MIGGDRGWLDPSNAWWTIALAAGLVVGSAGWMGAVARTETGMDLRETADRRAERWNASARLVSVGAGEHVHDEPHNHSSPWAQPTDDEVGEGHPPVWTYTYRSGNRSLRVTVAENGTVVNATETRAWDDTPITGWEVTATEAVETAREADERWDQIDARWAFYALHQEASEKDPAWILGVGDSDGLRVAVVNATTGEYVGSWGPHAGFYGWWGWSSGSGSWTHSWSNSWNGSWDGSWGGSDAAQEDRDDEPPAESGSFDGTLTAVEPEHEHTFEIQHAGHESLELQLELEDSVWNAVRADVRGPDGGELQLEATASEPTDEATWPRPAEGTYTVTVAFEQGPTVLEEGVMQEYEVHWCAPGESGMGHESEACPTDVRVEREEPAVPR